jgi:hypothetical protein
MALTLCDGPVTGTDGTSSCARKIGHAASGYFVQIDVTFTVGGQTYGANTGFTPQ